MGDVVKLGEGNERAMLAGMERAFRRVRAWQDSDAGRAAIERADEQQRAVRRREGRERAIARGVPDKAEVFAVVFAREPAVTPALEAVGCALCWRDGAAGADGSRSLLVILAGSVGCGKTVALARAVTAHSGAARFVRAADVAAIVRNGHSDPERARAALLDVDLLAIDELAVGVSLEGSERIRELITERYDAGRATLLAGNVDAAHVVARYVEHGSRLASRLRFEQERDGALDGCPWFFELPAVDLRDPANRAALEPGAR